MDPLDGEPAQVSPFADRLANRFEQSDASERARILSRLLESRGPGLLSALTDELAALFKSGAHVTPEQAQQVSPDSVRELAEHVHRDDPSIAESFTA
jgi:hypothetical protein